METSLHNATSRTYPLLPESTEAFKQKWTEFTSKCKRKLTLIWADEMKGKFSNVKQEIQSTLAEMETHLNQSQFKEIKESSSKFQAAAPATLQKKLKTGLPQKANFQTRKKELTRKKTHEPQ